jgi:hypothetical protein
MEPGKKLMDISIQNHDILRATYTEIDKNGKPKRTQKEFTVVLEE